MAHPKEVTVHRITDPRTEAADCHYVICRLVTELPIPMVAGCFIDICCKCGGRIWVAPSSPAEPPRICYSCVTPIVIADDDVHLLMTPNQLDRLTEGKKDG